MSAAMVDSGFVLIGKRVILQLFSSRDIDESYIGWLNDQDVVRFSNQRFLRHNSESCLRYLASFEGTANMFVSILRLSDKSLIGTLTAYIVRYHGTADVGIMIGDKSVWGSGYGQDAWNLFINWLLEREKIRKVTAGTLACNFGMIKLIERSGMSLEAVKRAQEIVDDQPVDILYFAKYRDHNA